MNRLDVNALLKSYPRRRPPLTSAHARVYAEQYRLNRDGGGLMEGLAQRLESWMHKRVSHLGEGPILELGAGTLNHRRYERADSIYDVVEPFRDLYVGRAETSQVRDFYGSIDEVSADRRYRRVISIAVLEHMENLPKDISAAALRLDDQGVFQAGIPSEGGLLWGIAWRLSTGISYYLRTGLDYGVVMRYEHLNQAPEIIAILRHLFRDVRVTHFPLPWHHCSFYAYVEARHPDRDRCLAIANGTE